MKRGKDDEKVMGPMFPRLHVNDTERGGPRAPPRNKMALYEQLSIPTQRFNSSFMPLNPPSTSSSCPPASSSQGNNLERNSFLPHSVPPSTSSRPSENFSAHQSARVLNSPLSQHEQRNKVGDEDDFSVPVYINSDMDHSHGKTQDDIDKGTASLFRQTYTGLSTRIQDISNQDPIRNSSPRNLPSRETTVGPVKGNSESPNQEYEDLPSPSFRRLNNGNTSLEQKSRAQAQQNDCSYDGESIREIEKGADSPPRCDSYCREDCCHPNEPNNHTDHCGNNTCEPLQLENGDKSDDFSETSMVDSMSGMNISPDDVVGIIGQKHFWKARRAIANQQRVFAVQVFELHRLIKVQKLIAGSPQYLHDDSAFLGKPTLKASSVKKLPSRYIVKPLPHIMKRKDDFEKPTHKMEHSAENAVGKIPPSSVNNGSHTLNCGPYRTNLPSTPPTPTPPTPTNDSRMNPWFQQSPGHQQWLVPVMSPSEGLVYKPYPGPGFVGSVCGGGCGPYGPIPMTGNFMNPAYGVPPPVHNQGMGVLPPSHPVGHGFFPPYGMPIMSPSIPNSAAEYNNQFTGPTSNGVGAYNSMQHRETSCYVPTQKSGSDQRAMEVQASRATDVQGSTTSSPRERVQANGMVSAGEGRDDVSTFHTAAPVMVMEEAAQSHETGQPGRVIRVVPHNPRSATESAARIFQSIQAERKHNDSV